MFCEASLLPDSICNHAVKPRGWRSALPRPLDGAIHVQTIDGIVEVRHEAATAQLAVCEDFESEVFLAGQRCYDMLVLDLGALRRGQARIAESVLQLLRAQQTANVVRSVHWAHPTSFGFMRALPRQG